MRSSITVLGLVLREAIDEHYLLFDPTARLRLGDGPDEPRPTAAPDRVRHLAARMPNLSSCTGRTVTLASVFRLSVIS